MGTNVRVLPGRCAAVSVGVLWGKRHRDPKPELLPVEEIGIAVIDCAGDEPVVEERYSLTGDDIAISADHLLDLALPIVAFNALRFDWLALGSLVDVEPLVPVTIDLYSSLYPTVSEIVDAEGASGFPVYGDYGVLNQSRLAETNLGFIPGESESAVGDAELAAALWIHFTTSERALIAGHSHSLDDESLDLLYGARPRFESATAWRAALSERPEPKPYRRRSRHQITFPNVDQRYV
jgi:hypothetical protein